MSGLVPEFINYWIEAGPHKFFRVFWFFAVFEFTRYILLDYLVAGLFYLRRKDRANEWKIAKQKLWIQSPLISIIVPGKNEGKHLYKLARSLAEQTYQNFELIVVDDGSDDNTAMIGKSLEKQGLIDRFIRNDRRGGKASAANTALSFSKGKYIVHLDADTSFDINAIENIIIPFYLDEKTGAVGGNVKVRNHKESLCARLQAVEYLKTISVGRIVTSYLGIYKIVSGAFGAFRPEVLRAIGGWDIGPGLDGDVTVKIRKSGYNIHFEPSAVCLTNAPSKFGALTRQRLRWNKSIIRFRLRKHRDVFLPNANFRWSNFLASFENVFYNVVLDLTWLIYMFDLFFHHSSLLHFVLPMNLLLYMGVSYLQMLSVYVFSERRKEELKLWKVIPLMTLYTGLYLRTVRTLAYFKEFLFKESYDDPWNPVKSSRMAKRFGF